MAHSCETCRFRAIYDKKPQSIIGRIWRWHIGFCPGWRSYMKSVSDEQRAELISKYNLKK